MINRNNYEEFFLLYTDNELTPEQREAVELFVQQNPDLQEEFSMLEQLKLAPDENIIFGGKESLFKTGESTPINLSNYEEYLLLYTDNELTEEERRATELFAEKHPQVKKELELYLKTKLPPETEIVFPGKESLYRTEKVARVVAMRWMRVAAAAVVILAIGITAVLILNKQSTDTPGKIEVVEVNSEAELKQTQPPADITLPDKNPVTDDKQGGTTGNPLYASHEKNEKQNSPANNPDKDEITDSNDKKSLFAYNDTPEKNTDTFTLPSLPGEKINSAMEPVNVDTETAPALLTDFNKGPVTAEPSYALNIINAADEDGNKKSRGLFRKATRLFERTTKIDAATDDNKLLIGSFAINLK